MTPTKHTYTCCECRTEYDARAVPYFQKAEGWVAPRQGGGTNHLSCKKLLQVFRCEPCNERDSKGERGQASFI